MFSIKRAIQRFHETCEHIGKARALAGLRAMDPNLLDKNGYSIAALNRGVEAWPWRKPDRPESSAAKAPAVSILSPGTPSRTSDSAPRPGHEDAA